MVDSRKGWIIFLLCAINSVYLYMKHRSGELTFLGVNFLTIEIPRVVCFSPIALSVPIAQLVVSTLVILVFCTVCQHARNGIKAYICDPLIQILLEEAVASAELCGCCFELIIVADNFGIFMYSVYLFLLTVWWNKVWASATACPYTHVEDVMQKRQEVQTALMKIWAELTGGIFVFSHGLTIPRITDCLSLDQPRLLGFVTFMTSTICAGVPMLSGALIEGAGTFFCQISGKIIHDINPKHGDIIGALLATSAVAAAFNYTGGYYNPVLATSLKFSCRGNTFMEHAIVYWLGACLGSILSVFVYDRTSINNYIQKRKVGCEIEEDKFD